MFSFSADVAILLANSTLETIYMVAVSVLLATVLGIPLGILLMVTDKGQILQNDIINSILGAVVNIFRSIPFIILLIVLIPFTRFVVGKSIEYNCSYCASINSCHSVYGKVNRNLAKRNK